MRYDCDDDAFAGDFVEFSDSWSRAQTRAAWEAWAAIPDSAQGKSEEEINAAEERHLATLRPKIVALHLTCVDAKPITGPADLTPARTEEMDTRLYSWWINLWMLHLRDLSNLGNALGRRLWDTSEADQKKATEKKQQPAARHRPSRKR